jgi:hypothetical protein
MPAPPLSKQNIYTMDKNRPMAMTIAHNSKSVRASGLLQVTHVFHENFVSKLIRIFQWSDLSYYMENLGNHQNN